MRNRIATVLAFLALAACGPDGFTDYDDSLDLAVDFDAEPAEEGGEEGGAGGTTSDGDPAVDTVPDMPDTEPLGYCCDCDVMVAPGLSCWVSNKGDCAGGKAEWCVGDEQSCQADICG